MYRAPGTTRTGRATGAARPARKATALAAAAAVVAVLALWSLAPGAAQAASVVLEAESATLAGGAATATDHAGYTGTGFVGGFTDGNKGAAKTSFTVQAATAGAATVAVRYANGTGSAKTLTLLVNGASAGQVTLPATANWDTWATVQQTVTLTGGANTVAYAFTAADSGNVNLDNLTATTGGSTPGGALEAESATLAGGAATATDHAGYTGTGFVGGFTDGNKGNATTTFAVTSAAAGSGTVSIRYANGTGSAKTLTLLVNGASAGQVTLPATANWDTWATVQQSVSFAAGANTVALKFTAADSGNVNLDSLTPATPTGTADPSPSPSGSGTPDPTGVGATLPYTGYEAEAGATNGTVLTPDRTYLSVASEASGRSAVTLSATGQYVEIRLTAPANALNLRYALPDSSDGKGLDATLSAYADGQALPDLQLTSRYAWVYGAYPYTNNPGDGEGHRFFDETRVTLGRTLPAGTVLRLQKDAGDTAASYTVDLVEAELTGVAGTLPAGYVSAADLGVTPGSQDVTAALNNALATAKSQGKGLFLPAGSYVVSDRVNLSGVKLRGAGVWYTVLRGTGLKGGLYGTGGTSTVENLMIDGQNTVRDDAGGQAGIEGDFGTGSVIRNVWIQHTKVGLWINAPTKGLQASDLRIRNTYADGVNLHGAVDSTVVSNSSIRGTGDDALAMWSDGAAVTNSAFRNNTVQLPSLANGAAVYGGSGNSVEHNLISDTVTAGAGITVSTRFGQPFTGATTVTGNLLRRTGSLEVNWNSKLGAVWVYADQSDITTPVVLDDNTVEDSTYSGLLLSWQKQIADLRVDGLTITRTGNNGIEGNAAGHGTFSRTTVTATADVPLNVTGGFTIQRGTGNSGW
ncbi:carbohydrate-binding protein [Streptomyces sp. TLI_171]|uniref:carbohydrate-binding protein n=1 Tax=Streptomyces sp. TLI_171 TaxID=1938859 RepID=UPI000C646E26|nr:carbohydrate-binding protein [Streptomyces sp. TLI_171]RKE17277.1 carbohydrate binding protein with CBM6 domain [Streptomyces sp. TLI_171]